MPLVHSKFSDSQQLEEVLRWAGLKTNLRGMWSRWWWWWWGTTSIELEKLIEYGGRIKAKLTSKSWNWAVTVFGPHGEKLFPCHNFNPEICLVLHSPSYLVVARYFVWMRENGEGYVSLPCRHRNVSDFLLHALEKRWQAILETGTFKT
jgi:hypothetical protein